MNSQHHATILAALRHFQNYLGEMGPERRELLHQEFPHFDDDEPLDHDGINELCENLTFDDYSTNITLNSFDDCGVVVDTTNMDISRSAVSDIIDHSAQLIIVGDSLAQNKETDSSRSFKAVYEQLAEALSTAGVVSDELQIPQTV